MKKFADIREILTYYKIIIDLWKNLQREIVDSIFHFAGFPSLCANHKILHIISLPLKEILKKLLKCTPVSKEWNP